MGRIKLFIVSIIFFGSNFVSAQSTNLEVCFSLVDKSADDIVLAENLKDEINLDFSAPAEFDFFKGRLISRLNEKHGIKFNGAGDSRKLEYFLENMEVKYTDLFKDGLFGDYYLEREVNIRGNYLMSDQGNIRTQKFNSSVKDTVLYDKISDLETASLPFTKSDVPEEPFWESLVEPVVVIGGAVISVILFFTVRSN